MNEQEREAFEAWCKAEKRRHLWLMRFSRDPEPVEAAAWEAWQARAALAAQAVPDGWKLVPVEPTLKMIEAGRMATDDKLYPQDFVDGPRMQMRDKWVAMLAATPAPAPEATPLKERPDFIAGYDAGLIDGRACERRDQAEADHIGKAWDNGFNAGRLHGLAEAEATPAQAQHADLTKRLAGALQPFVLANSSDEHMTLIVRSADVTQARAALAEYEATPAQAQQAALPTLCDQIAKHLGSGWLVIGPDGSRFQGPTPHRAANAASKHHSRLMYDPAMAAALKEGMDAIRRDSEAENARLMAEFGSLNCPACGGSGHIGDALAATKAEAKPLTDEQIDDLAEPFIFDLGGDHWYSGERGISEGGVQDFARAIEAAHGIKENKHD